MPFQTTHVHSDEKHNKRTYTDTHYLTVTFVRKLLEEEDEVEEEEEFPDDEEEATTPG
jgi:hypothetical protein